MLISLAQIKMKDTLQNLGNPAIPNPFGTRDWFPGRQFFCGPAGEGESFGMIQVQMITFTVHFISSLMLLLI